MKGTQNKRLLSHLQEGRTINPLEAWQKLGIYRLSARIFDLRDSGHNIKMERKEVHNQFDEVVNVAEYSLTEEVK